MAAVARMQSAPPSSHFAALLRRSKFASFDPRIGQVYTSFDGDAHRGNWGLKRPLAIRRRTAHITIRSIDSREQQTVWKPADNEARWIKMWDEVGIYPATSTGPWATKLGPTVDTNPVFDTEFARASEGREAWRKKGASNVWGPQSSALPNVESMSDREFEAYLKRLRKMRPAFKEYLKEVAQVKPDIPFTSLWTRSMNPGVLHQRFLSRQVHEFYNSPDSLVIEQQPDKAAGLSYTRTSQLQSFLYTKPRKGRYLGSSSAGKDLFVGYAGMNTHLSSTFKRKDVDAVDWNSLEEFGSPNENHVAKMRFIKAELAKAPGVVGTKPQGLEGMRLDTHAMDVDSDMHLRSNPHRPGSREYVAYMESLTGSQTGNVLHQNVAATVRKANKSANVEGRVLDTLSRMIRNNPQRSSNSRLNK